MVVDINELSDRLALQCNAPTDTFSGNDDAYREFISEKISGTATVMINKQRLKENRGAQQRPVMNHSR